MQHAAKVVKGSLLVGALALAGCSNTGVSNTPTTKSVASISVASPAIDGVSIPARYTCDGGDVSPPLEWGKVPIGTKSLLLFAVGLTPEPSTHTFELSVGWAVAGLNPKLHKIAAGRLPAGTFLGVNSLGKQDYSLCPPKGPQVEYQFELYGLPATEKVAPNFGGLAVVRELQAANSPINARGFLSTAYKRR
ncbi:MAG TPA: YbhB/YbcL family Raf kinase inhibitor-like protein [Solirubrobacteraceae bacterium]|nr:YbhB/YbcL family Raf kinase inhibitor-like protein [Solirubrobacteraceae bacterium]